MYNCRQLFSFVVGMLVILITPPGVEHGLAVLEEVFGPLPAPRTSPLAFFTPSMFLTLVFPPYRRRIVYLTVWQPSPPQILPQQLQVR